MKTENRDRTLLVTGGGGTGLPQNKPDGFSISVFGRFTYMLSALGGLTFGILIGCACWVFGR